MEDTPEVRRCAAPWCERVLVQNEGEPWRSEEHTSELK